MSDPALLEAGGTSPQQPVPDVSVLVPSYGYAHYIGDAIESVLQQTGPPTELIVQDGCSDDGTVDVLGRYEGTLRWASEPDRGQSDALNKAWTRAQGRWVGWLNADEFYLPGGLSALVAEGDRTSADVVYGDTAFVDADGRLARLVPEHRFSPKVLESYGCFISTVSCLVRRSSVEAAPIDSGMRRMMDWDLYLRMLRGGARFGYVPTPVGAFRQHDTRITATETRGFFQRLNLGDGFGEEYELMRRRYGAFRARRAGHLLHGGLKLVDGGYRRQMRARRLGDVDLRWFAGAPGTAGYTRLISEAYPHLST